MCCCAALIHLIINDVDNLIHLIINDVNNLISSLWKSRELKVPAHSECFMLKELNMFLRVNSHS